MGKRIVTVEVTRYYSKSSTIEIEVDDELVDDALVDFLTGDETIDDLYENALYDASMVAEDTTYEYSDITNNMGGHL